MGLVPCSNAIVRSSIASSPATDAATPESVLFGSAHRKWSTIDSGSQSAPRIEEHRIREQRRRLR